MKKVEFKKLNFSMDLDKILLSMDVGSGAEPCADVTEFYQNTLVTPLSAEMFLNVPGNKHTKRIPLLTTGRVMQPFTCSFNGKDVDLNAKEVSVDKVAVMTDICISDIEDSFEVSNMIAGANNQVNPQAFLSYVWGEIAKSTKADLEWLRFNGDKTSGDAFVKLTNGYVALMGANIASVNVVSTPVAITPSNVITELYRLIGEIPAVLRQDPSKLNIFVSANVALAFAVAAAQGNTMAYITGDMGNMFLGKYKITEVVDLADNTMFGGPKQDFIYTYDLVDENFITADLTHTMAEPVIRFRVNMYFGFDIYKYSNLAYYGPVLS